MKKISWIDGLKNEMLHRVKWKGTAYKQRNEGRLNGFVTSCVESAFLKHVFDGKIDRKIAGTGRRGRQRKHILDDLKEKENLVALERESTRSHSVRNSLWQRLWTCRKADYVNEIRFSDKF
jgi:hypothetical protein